jgi:hypothetical protein
VTISFWIISIASDRKHNSNWLMIKEFIHITENPGEKVALDMTDDTR